METSQKDVMVQKEVKGLQKAFFPSRVEGLQIDQFSQSKGWNRSISRLSCLPCARLCPVILNESLALKKLESFTQLFVEHLSWDFIAGEHWDTRQP